MRKLVPYQTILAAKKGDSEAMSLILRHYANYITYYSRRGCTDKRGNRQFDVNEDVKQQIEAKLIIAVVCSFDHTRLPIGEMLEG